MCLCNLTSGWFVVSNNLEHVVMCLCHISHWVKYGTVSSRSSEHSKCFYTSNKIQVKYVEFVLVTKL